jgi:hypothetical protein
MINMRKIFGPKRDEVRGIGGDGVVRSFVICSVHQVIIGNSDQQGQNGLGIGTYWGERRTAFLVERPEVKRPLGRPRLREEDNIKTDILEMDKQRVLKRSGSGWRHLTLFLGTQ